MKNLSLIFGIFLSAHAFAGDWVDVTTNGDGVTKAACAQFPAHCTYQGRFSSDQFSKLAPTRMKWSEAIAYCTKLQHNGKTDWRLPLKNELSRAGRLDIKSLKSEHFIGNFERPFWSAFENGPLGGWVDLNDGMSGPGDKWQKNNVICVRTAE